MLDGLIALIALERTGTVSEAAIQLRLTQSAVSKRLHVLEEELGFKLMEPDGRKLRLTSKGLALLAKAKPLLNEIAGLRDLDEAITLRTFSIGISDSIASSWGPKLIRKTLQKSVGLNLEIHVHRSTLILEQLRSGRYDIGLLTGSPQGTDLVWDCIAEESMVLVGSSGKSSHRGKILSIEMNSATWKQIGRDLVNHDRFKEKEFIYVESFSAAAQMAKEEFGQALVPAGLAKSLNFKSHETSQISPRIKRHIHLVARKSLQGLQCITEITSNMKSIAAELV